VKRLAITSLLGLCLILFLVAPASGGTARPTAGTLPCLPIPILGQILCGLV
jgi:hypothetical protein